MAIDFPASPTLNQTFTSGNVNYVWDGTKWTAAVSGGIALDQITEGNTKAEVIDTGSDGRFVVTTEGSERLRVDANGRLGVGTASPATNLHVAGNVLVREGDYIYGNATTGNRSYIQMYGGASGEMTIATTFSNSFIKFLTADTERMRIASGGDVFIAKTAVDRSLKGFQYEFAGAVLTLTADDTRPLDINRQTNDGDLIRFFQANTQEGSISVSGTTVSYNGAHLSRWSQLPSGAERTEILRGSVLSNIDEMCEWGDEENEQLNRMKVSNVEGDKNVSGVFQGWDDDDDTYTNDFYCAMTGDFIIRIGAGVTVERGDLLMSAGDGTAKPQDDDIIRSKTIAKVTSTNVSCTYDDGSYCVPCILMAC